MNKCAVSFLSSLSSMSNRSHYSCRDSTQVIFSLKKGGADNVIEQGVLLKIQTSDQVSLTVLCPAVMLIVFFVFFLFEIESGEKM